MRAGTFGKFETNGTGGAGEQGAGSVGAEAWIGKGLECVGDVATDGAPYRLDETFDGFLLRGCGKCCVGGEGG